MTVQILNFDNVDEPTALPRHDAERLTKGGKMAEIRLGEQIYTLRITRQGKLLLTK